MNLIRKDGTCAACGSDDCACVLLFLNLKEFASVASHLARRHGLDPVTAEAFVESAIAGTRAPKLIVDSVRERFTGTPAPTPHTVPLAGHNGVEGELQSE